MAVGLSDEERYRNICFGISELRELLAGLEKMSPPYQHEACTARVVVLGNELWHCLLGKKSNKSFWVTGSETDNPIGVQGSLWSVAVANLCDAHSSADDSEPPSEFNPFDSFLGTQGLLAHAAEGRFYCKIYDIYREVEQILYSLRRYKDGFLSGLSRLGTALSEIQGACFGIFAREELYGRAYVLNRILVAIYGGEYPKPDDCVRKIFDRLNMHHDLSRPMIDGSLRECLEWNRWRITEQDTPQNRAVLALQISGRRFHYDHQFKQLVAGLKDATPQIDVDRLRQVFLQCQDAHKACGAESMMRYKRDAKSSEISAIHGSVFAYEVCQPPKKADRSEPESESSAPSSSLDTDDTLVS